LGELKKWAIFSLMGSRFVVLFFLLFFLLSPVFRYLKLVFEEPLIILAFDNSESLKKFNTSETEQKLLRDLPALIGKDFKIKTYLFGEKLSDNKTVDYSEKETDFDPLFEEIKKNYTNYNIGALIIASDGIYNKGNNPVYGAKDLAFPVYTISLGDTTKRKDIVVKSVYSNKFAFSGDLFPVEVLINAKGFAGEKTNLKIYNQGKEIKNIPIDIKLDDFSNLLKIDIEPEKSGLQTYIFKIDLKPGEYNPDNNAQELVIDIIDNKKKVLILANSVHPDIGAIQLALEGNKTITVESYTINDFKKNINDYQLVIFHQLPSIQYNLQKEVSAMIKSNIPALFIFGQNTDIQSFNLLKCGLTIQRTNNLYEQSLPVFNQSFKLFETDPLFNDFIKDCPPLNVPFAQFDLSSDMNILLFQKIKSVTTNYPLMAFSQGGGIEKIKSGIILGDGIWQWRIRNYLNYDDHLLFDGFINKIVNYLATDLKKERFMIFNNRVFKENEEIFFRAELYNPAYELVNDPEVGMIVKNDNNKEFTYQFEKIRKAYELNAGRLPVGAYKFDASTSFDNVNFKKSGEFRVVPIDVEQMDLSANYNILMQLSAQTGGKMFNINQLGSLTDELKQNEQIKKISHSTIDLVGLIELKWLLFLIILLLSTEWFVRKYFGAY